MSTAARVAVRRTRSLSTERKLNRAAWAISGTSFGGEGDSNGWRRSNDSGAGRSRQGGRPRDASSDRRQAGGHQRGGGSDQRQRGRAPAAAASSSSSVLRAE
ncbi:expressed unknown protein [Ectocarpus siliculosus]|uniref:Uncharacterized protein n=1 Tax=Ectocarpus siliculosus TaxID=2880 RepID=D7G238_ECTSI|nr:expressed unknown protein [Ectocarpus siliculosus]|eukprot:CBJ33341.1 expressed unknown protein [Ectocarpus siliculosus]